jgi:hypothetical protein
VSKLIAQRLPLRQRLLATHRALPDFIVIGAQRAGTTSFYAYLGQHPDVVPAIRKEVHFFDQGWELGTTWYRAHFPLRRSLHGGRVTGEATPMLLYDPRAPERVHAVVPEARLIALLRDPVARVHSNYWNGRRRGTERIETFEQAIDTDRARGRRYLERGHYAEQLERWWTVFPRDQLLVLVSEELFADPGGVTNRAVEWLGLPPFELKRPYRLNDSPVGTPLRPETEEQLRAYYEPHNRRLYELLERDLGWGRAVRAE